LPVLAAGSGGAAVQAEQVSRMPLQEVFRRRQEYGAALQCLFDAGAARPGCPAQADLARLVGLWVRVAAACFPLLSLAPFGQISLLLCQTSLSCPT
jgi:hypothetical protein